VDEKSLGETNCGNVELAFLANAIKESKNKSKKATPDAISIKQPKMIFEFGVPSIIAYSKRNIRAPRPVRSRGQFLHFIFLMYL